MSLDKLPGVAEVAMQTGLYAGRRVAHLARGQDFDKPFKYRDLGSAAYISRGTAVVSAFKMNFGAVLGWWFAFTRDLRRERTFTIDDMPVAAGPYGVNQPAPGDTAAPRGPAER